MSKSLSDTAAIAAKPVTETANPDYSCFHARSHKAMCDPMRNTSVGPERPALARQVLEAKRPGSRSEESGK